MVALVKLALPDVYQRVAIMHRVKLDIDTEKIFFLASRPIQPHVSFQAKLTDHPGHTPL